MVEMNNKRFKDRNGLPKAGAVKGHHHYNAVPHLVYRSLPSGWRGYVIVFEK